LTKFKETTPYYDNGLGIVYATESGEIIVLNPSDIVSESENKEYLTIYTPEFGLLNSYLERDETRLVPKEKDDHKK